MPTVTIPDDTYEPLVRKAAAVGVSPGGFIALAVSTLRLLPHFTAPQVLEGEAWWAMLEEIRGEAQSRAADYPPGFELDVSREAMYEERERGQL